MTRKSPDIIADSQNPETTCAGDKSFEDCEIAQVLLESNKGYEMPGDRATANGNYVRLLDDKRVCDVCQFVCSLSIEIIELKPSGNARLHCQPPVK